MKQQLSAAPGARRTATLDGALAAAVQLAVGELVAAALPGGRSPITGLGATLVDATPGPVVDIVVATAESADKALLKGQLVGGWLAVGAVSSRRGPATAGAALGALGLLAGACAAARRDAAAPASLAAGTAGALAGRAGVALLAHRPTTSSRAVLAAGTLAALAAASGRRRAERARLERRRAAVALPTPRVPAAAVPSATAFAVEGLSPLLTPVEDFYVTDVTFPAPHVDLDRWRLRVHGMVDRPLELSFDDLLALDPVELDATLVCVHNPVGGPRIGSARWVGIPIQTLLDRAGVQPDAQQLIARAVDGFTAGVPVERVSGTHPALVAVAMNGQPLPVEHGYPARLLVPGLWGADANTKWLSELELTTWGAVRDYWDRRGWPRTPSAVRPGSRIDTPVNRATVQAGPVTVSGVAWAPPGGVEDVHVSIDGGPWQPTELSPEVAPTLWRQWRLTWAAAPRTHFLRVRTTGRDRVQHDDRQPPYPVGSSGLHEIAVRVTADAPTPSQLGSARIGAIADDARGRAALAAAATVAWRARGYPLAPRFPAPQRRGTGAQDSP